MAVEIRPAHKDEMLDFGAVAAYVYAGTFGDEPDNIASQANKPEWTLCAFVDGVMASTFSTLPFKMSALGNTVDLGGITTVGTLPEFRRQGLVRKITTQAISDMHDKGQAVTTLWASQAAIYQRYQFAMAGVRRNYLVDTVDIGFFDGNMGSCTVAGSDLDEGFDTLKTVYDEFIADRMCYIKRRTGTWRYNVLAQDESEGPVHIALCKDNSTSVGYVAYTMRGGRVDHRSRSHQLNIRDLVALNGDAYRSLWRFIASHDMVGRVSWSTAPMDDPAMELFMEPRMLHCQDNEGIWLRIVDVEKALTERGYVNSGSIRIGIAQDDLAPWNTGTYEVEVSPQGAMVRKVEGEGDLQLSVKALASLYSGFRNATELGRYGLLAGDSNSLARADNIFFTPHKPHCPDNF